MSVRRFFLPVLLLLCIGVQPASAQDVGHMPEDAPASFGTDEAIAKAMINGHDTVYRIDARRMDVRDRDDVRLHVHRVITVLNEDGREAGSALYIPYDSFRKVDDLDGRVYDAEGKEVYDLDDEHLSDFSGSGGSLYTDARIQVAHMYHDSYPYTVEYRYTLEMNSAFMLSAYPWYPQKKDAPVQYGHYEVSYPSSLDIRTRVVNDSLDGVRSQVEDEKRIRWTVTDRAPYEREPYGPRYVRVAPRIEVGPTDFEIEDTRGSMASWKEFGAWYHQLEQGRQDLSESARQQMRALVAGAPTKRDSVARLYRHLQEKSRYVSVQLGIGGWQPFPASYVEERSYGDCKALTNYMKAALDAVGIESFSVLIYRGVRHPEVTPDFPKNQFNHVVLAVPTAQDTLWLENTSQTAPFGYVSVDIEDRYGLWVNEDGGTLVRTPKSQMENHFQFRTADVRLKPNGNAHASVVTTYGGAQSERTRYYLVRESPRDQKKWLRNRIAVSNFDLTRADFSSVEGRSDTVAVPFDMRMPRFAPQTGSRLFVTLNLMNRASFIPDEMDDVRTQSIHSSPYPYVDVDTVRFELPDGYTVEAAPEPVHLETEFATYDATFTADEGQMTFVRRIEMRSKVLPPDLYDDFRTFFLDVVRADNAKAVLVKKKS